MIYDNQVYLSQKQYTHKEIGDFLGIDFKSHNYKRSAIKKLENLGYTSDKYEWVPRKGINILWKPTTPEERIQYLVIRLGIDSRVDAKAFALVIYGMLYDEDLQGVPWSIRAEMVRENYGVDVSERTLKKWLKSLEDLGELTKDKQHYRWWKTYYNECGDRIREEVPEDDPELQQYREDIRHCYATGQEINLWSKYKCRYYRSYYLTFGAWHNTELFDELMVAVVEYLAAARS